MGDQSFSLEVVQVPVSDVDRALGFYRDQLGFGLDHDTGPDESFRVVQLTPPGSGCSIQIGTGLSDMVPGSLRGLLLVVDDIDEAREKLTGNGVEAGEVQNLGRPGREPFKHVFFDDPDGNGWVLQQRRAG